MSKRYGNKLASNSTSIYAAPFDHLSPTVEMYGVGSPYDGTGQWYPQSQPSDTFTIGVPNPFAFLQPLLDLGVDAKTACVLWAKFKEGAIAIVGLARLIDKKPFEIIDDPKLFAKALDKLEELMG